MNNTTSINIDLGNNESLTRGIFKNNNGTYTALSWSQSKTFKTYNGAYKWLTRITQK